MPARPEDLNTEWRSLLAQARADLMTVFECVDAVHRVIQKTPPLQLLVSNEAFSPGNPPKPITVDHCDFAISRDACVRVGDLDKILQAVNQRLEGVIAGLPSSPVER